MPLMVNLIVLANIGSCNLKEPIDSGKSAIMTMNFEFPISTSTLEILPAPESKTEIRNILMKSLKV